MPMLRSLILAFSSVTLATFILTPIARSQTVLAERDLALIFPLESMNLVPAGLSFNGTGEKLLAPKWFDEVNSAFRETSAGTVLETESPYSDWHVVSVRVAPCNPLGQNPQQQIEELCWPELRLVWQPVLRKVTLHSTFMVASGDDRAIHAIYPIDPSTQLNPEETVRVRTALNAIAKAVGTDAKFSTLPAAQMNDFTALRNRVVTGYLSDIATLRTAAKADYSGVGIRPEWMNDSIAEKSFRKAFDAILEKYAKPKALGALTAFSLPEGREPAQLDEWIFLSFKAVNGSIERNPMTLVSSTSNEVLFTGSHASRGSMQRDDEAFYEADNLEAIKSTAILFMNDKAKLVPLISDRTKRLVPNTTCVSCHKLNDLIFDFHNLSYLEDREVTISPRVVKDVALDLQWIKAHAIKLSR